MMENLCQINTPRTQGYFFPQNSIAEVQYLFRIEMHIDISYPAPDYLWQRLFQDECSWGLKKFFLPYFPGMNAIPWLLHIKNDEVPNVIAKLNPKTSKSIRCQATFSCSYQTLISSRRWFTQRNNIPLPSIWF
jgi:hypothetical protein